LADKTTRSAALDGRRARTTDKDVPRASRRKSTAPVAATPEPVIVDAPEEPEAEPGIFLWWADRRQATLSIPKPRILEEVPEHSDPTDEDPGNLLIQGDNRQAMVSLLSHYAGKVDVVVIDPPYNTGRRDLRYNDARFADPDADGKGAYVSAEDGGKHTKWLNQMAPTLRVIRELMAAHGVIFIHIDDRELPRLLLLMEEIFDESNRIGLLVWKSATDNNPSQIVVEHEYISRFPSPLRARVRQPRLLTPNGDASWSPSIFQQAKCHHLGVTRVPPPGSH
jgi:hypothetical protein